MTRDCCCTLHLHHILCSAHTHTRATARRDSFIHSSIHVTHSFKCRTQARTERARAVRHETLHRTCAAVSVKNKCWRPFLDLSYFGMSLRRFRSGYLRGAGRGTDVAFCVVGGRVDFEGPFAYFFDGFLFLSVYVTTGRLFLVLENPCLPVSGTALGFAWFKASRTRVSRWLSRVCAQKRQGLRFRILPGFAYWKVEVLLHLSPLCVLARSCFVLRCTLSRVPRVKCFDSRTLHFSYPFLEWTQLRC